MNEEINGGPSVCLPLNFHVSQHGVDAVLFELVAVEAQLRVDR